MQLRRREGQPTAAPMRAENAASLPEFMAVLSSAAEHCTEKKTMADTRITLRATSRDGNASASTRRLRHCLVPRQPAASFTPSVASGHGTPRCSHDEIFRRSLGLNWIRTTSGHAQPASIPGASDVMARHGHDRLIDTIGLLERVPVDDAFPVEWDRPRIASSRFRGTEHENSVARRVLDAF